MPSLRDIVTVCTSDFTGLLALGATLVATYPDHHWLTDPEGNEFCVFP